MERSKRVKVDLSHMKSIRNLPLTSKEAAGQKYTERTLRRVFRRKKKEKNKEGYLGQEKNGLRKGKNAKG